LIKKLAHPVLVRCVVRYPKRRQLAVSEREMHPPRYLALKLREQTAVKSGLQESPRLRRSRELCVYDLVSTANARRGSVCRRQGICANQEVRPSKQGRGPVAGRSQHPLVDHIGSTQERIPRRGCRLIFRHLGHLNNLEPLGSESSQNASLMLFA